MPGFSSASTEILRTTPPHPGSKPIPLRPGGNTTPKASGLPGCWRTESEKRESACGAKTVSAMPIIKGLSKFCRTLPLSRWMLPPSPWLIIPAARPSWRSNAFSPTKKTPRCWVLRKAAAGRQGSIIWQSAIISEPSPALRLHRKGLSLSGGSRTAPHLSDGHDL